MDKSATRDDPFTPPVVTYDPQTIERKWQRIWQERGTNHTDLESAGLMVDWRYRLATTDPNYYKWTQWLFLQLFKQGLAYRKKAAVNWCPSCKTVLANEQVVSGGFCERCGTEVEQRLLEQWFFRISDYAARLLENLDHIDWSE